jgi:hypothetical protein
LSDVPVTSDVAALADSSPSEDAAVDTAEVDAACPKTRGVSR